MSERETATPKERIMTIVEDQPDDSSFDEILHELAFARMIERGIADADEGRTFDHEDVKHKAASWSK